MYVERCLNVILIIKTVYLLFYQETHLVHLTARFRQTRYEWRKCLFYTENVLNTNVCVSR